MKLKIDEIIIKDCKDNLNLIIFRCKERYFFTVKYDKNFVSTNIDSNNFKYIYIEGLLIYITTEFNSIFKHILQEVDYLELVEMLI